MNILLIQSSVTPKRLKIYSAGVGSIFSVTKQAGHQVKLLVITHPSEYNDLMNEIASFKPQVVGFSVIGFQFHFVKQMATLVKAQAPTTVIICGGAHPTIYPQALLEQGADVIDGFFIGESELAFVEFLQRVEKGLPCQDTDNFCYVRDGTLVQNPLKPLIQDLAALPFPDKEVDPYRQWLLHPSRQPLGEEAGLAPFVFSRGCPYRCSYCSNHAIAGVYALCSLKFSEQSQIPVPQNALKTGFLSTSVRITLPDRENLSVQLCPRSQEVPFLGKNGFESGQISECVGNLSEKAVYGKKHFQPRSRSPESCIQEIEAVIARYGDLVKTVYIMDEIFGVNRQWRQEFCQKYKERIGKRFVIMTRVNIVNDDSLTMLKDAGCCFMCLGVECGNEKFRMDVLNRPISNAEMIHAFDLCHQYGIDAWSFNMIGLPGESEEMIWETVNLNRRLRPERSMVWVYCPFRGTELGDRCFREGLVDEQKILGFDDNRGDTLLEFPEEHKKRLAWFHANWETLLASPQ